MSAPDPDRKAREAFEEWFAGFWEERNTRHQRLTIDQNFGRLVWRAALAWTAARRPDAGLRVTEEAKLAAAKALAVDAEGNGEPEWGRLHEDIQRAYLRAIDIVLAAAIPHLRPDAGQDEDKADAKRLRWLIENRFGNYEGRYEFRWAYGLAPQPGPSIDEIRHLIDADRARAGEEESKDV